MSAAKEKDVETQLRLAAATAAWPATPTLRAPVLARIEAAGEGRVGARPRRLRPLAGLALALIALLALAGVAAGLGFRLPGLDIILVDRLPAASGNPVGPTSAAGAGLDLGSPIPLGEAQALDRPRVRLPSSMPDPDVAYLIGAGDRRIVTLAWRAETGQPTIPGSDLALTVMAVPGSTGDALIKKLISSDTTIDAVSIDGDRGWWISGAPHEIMIARPDGDVGAVRSALAGDTLVFDRDGTVYRLESALGRDATIAIAEGLR